MNFMVLLEVFADIANFLCGKISVSPSKNSKIITVSLGVVAAAYTLLKFFRVDIINRLIYIIQNSLFEICGFVIIIAVIPPIIAFYERQNPDKPVRKDYIWKNLALNIAGCASAISMIYAAFKEIKDFRFIEDFQIDSIIAILVPICVWIVFSYQSIEQQKYACETKSFNHDPSLRWINQMFNVLHLINVCFWALISSVLVVAYTLYCHIHNIQLDLEWPYLWLLTMVLIFFYLCAFVEHDYIKLVFLIDVPLILICSMYWMSWFRIDQTMEFLQFIFFLVHSVVYTLLIYRKEKVIARCMSVNETDPDYKIYFRRIRVKIKNWFSIITIGIIIMAYMIFWIVPHFLIERDSFAFVENCVIEICYGTEKNAEESLCEIKTLNWYDAERDNVDRAHLLNYINENFLQEMVDKKIISGTDNGISYEELVNWYINVKRHRINCDGDESLRQS